MTTRSRPSPWVLVSAAGRGRLPRTPSPRPRRVLVVLPKATHSDLSRSATPRGCRWGSAGRSAPTPARVRSADRPAFRLARRHVRRAEAWPVLARAGRISTGDDCRGHRRPTAVDDHVMFTSVFPPLDKAGAGLLTSPRARNDRLSDAARDQSIRSAPFNSARSLSWSFCRNPCLVPMAEPPPAGMPVPQPISQGRSSEGMPDLRTNGMAVNALRSSTGLPPVSKPMFLGFGQGRLNSFPKGVGKQWIGH